MLGRVSEKVLLSISRKKFTVLLSAIMFWKGLANGTSYHG
jgi:hypothetical protein